MKYRPILFSTAMVQALLAGKKTMTRRTKGLEFINESFSEWEYLGTDELGHLMANEEGETNGIKCPYGKPGDILWVRERSRPLVNCQTGEAAGFAYYADMPADFHKQYPHKWKPSIHMPRVACRLYLKITNVGVERLQDISEKDAIKEGAKNTIPLSEFESLTGLGDWKIPSPFLMHQFGFLLIWCKINGCESWLANPWVWVVEFERVENPQPLI